MLEPRRYGLSNVYTTGSQHAGSGDRSPSVQSTSLEDAMEREERLVAMWMVFYHETLVGASSGWGTSFSHEDVTVPLPVSAIDFDAAGSDLKPNPQSTASADFTTHTVTDHFVIALKSAVLLNRVTRLVRRWKDWAMSAKGILGSANFIQLTSDIACIQLGIPSPPIGNLLSGNVDVDLIACHLIPHICVIGLYSPVARVSDPTDMSAQRILSASRQIVAIAQQLAGLSSFFIHTMDVVISV